LAVHTQPLAPLHADRTGSHTAHEPPRLAWFVPMRQRPPPRKR
jgi:hypothetical protein